MFLRIMALALVYAFILVLAPSDLEGAMLTGVPAVHSTAAMADSVRIPGVR
jgi:hypothetical protein